MPDIKTNTRHGFARQLYAKNSYYLLNLTKNKPLWQTQILSKTTFTYVWMDVWMVVWCCPHYIHGLGIVGSAFYYTWPSCSTGLVFILSFEAPDPGGHVVDIKVSHGKCLPCLFIIAFLLLGAGWYDQVRDKR